MHVLTRCDNGDINLLAIRVMLLFTYYKLHLIFMIFSKACNADHWEYKLVTDLLNGYDVSIRPSKQHNLTLNVTFGLALAQLIDVVKWFTFVS
jgi:hypothetical protein